MDAPSYFFVSTQVANEYPTLMESMMVLSYRSIFPGEIANKWHFAQKSFHPHLMESWSEVLDIRRIFTFLNSFLILSLMKFITSAPLPLQKLLIRFGEALFLGAIVFIWLYIAQSWISISIFTVICFIAGLGLSYRYVWDLINEKKAKISAEPMKEENISLEDLEMKLHNNNEEAITALPKSVIGKQSNSSSGSSLWNNSIWENDSVCDDEFDDIISVSSIGSDELELIQTGGDVEDENIGSEYHDDLLIDIFDKFDD
jgi:hypothetical protein